MKTTNLEKFIKRLGGVGCLLRYQPNNDWRALNKVPVLT